MNEEFLTQLGLDEEQSASIIAAHERELLGERAERELAAAGALDCDAAGALLNTEGMNRENISERIAALKEAHPTLFRAQKAPRIVSSARAECGITGGEFAKMGYLERLKLFRENPELYKKLV